MAIKNPFNKTLHPGNTVPGVIFMEKKKTDSNVHLDPEERICPAFDSCSIKKFAAPDRKEMGVYVLDNCAEEHMM